jgi:hypothetical protein
MNFDTVNGLIASLGTIRYFPSDPPVRLALVELMSELTDDEDAVRWLVKRARQVFKEWPGEYELRALFCSRFTPKDRYEVVSYEYSHGPTNLRPGPVPDLPALPPGHVASADPELDAHIRALTVRKLM